MNFDQPYRATSLREFWRRWHMSLSRFLRDYLYIPLGGSRAGFGRFVFATMVTMGLCGLWHGAGWPFVLWGLVHGAGLVVCRAWQMRGYELPDGLGWVLTFLFAVAAFVPFRAPDLGTTVQMLKGMLGAGGVGALPAPRELALLGIAMALAHLPWSNRVLVERLMRPHPALAVASAALAFWGILEVGRGVPASFIYFQF
jgi:D-alanyl-lipoteichoic acid acyltransferase DltB (MBOAT superfamily)